MPARPFFRPAALRLVAALAVAPGAVLAQEIPPAHSVELGWEVGRFYYKESISGPHFMEEQGFLAGPVLDYRFRAPTGLELFVEAGHWRGTIEYHGTLSDSSGNVVGETHLDNRQRLTELRVGGAIPVEGTGAELYAGYGYRRWFDGLGAHSDGGGYDRITRYHYLPLGVRWARPLGGEWRITARAENDLFLYGLNTSRFSQLDQYETNAEFSQDNGWGGRLSAGVEGAVSDHLRAGVGLFLRHWRVETSSSDSVRRTNGGFDSYEEPRNRTTFYGLRAYGRFGAGDL